MKKNKITLALSMSLITSMAYSSNFKVIIDQENNTYTSGKLIVVESEWIEKNKSCEFDIETSEIYKNISFEQTKTCETTFEKTKTTKMVYDDGTPDQILLVTTTEKTETEISKTNEVGTHLENSCKDIQTFDSDLSDGSYELSLSGNPVVYCDMTRNGGGWMRVTNYNWAENQNNIPSTLEKGNSKTIFYDNQTFLLADGWWVSPWGSQPANTMRWVEIDAQPITSWSETMIDFEGLGYRSLDEFYNVHNAGISDRSTVNGQYVDGFSFTYGNQGNRGHLFTVAVGYLTPADDENRLSGELSWIESNYDYKDNTELLSGYSSVLYSKTITGKTKPYGNEKISLRLMADQVEGDETIGIRKYILWVR
jgi:hypothetical protein